MLERNIDGNMESNDISFGRQITNKECIQSCVLEREMAKKRELSVGMRSVDNGYAMHLVH